MEPFVSFVVSCGTRISQRGAPTQKRGQPIIWPKLHEDPPLVVSYITVRIWSRLGNFLAHKVNVFHRETLSHKLWMWNAIDDAKIWIRDVLKETLNPCAFESTLYLEVSKPCSKMICFHKKQLLNNKLVCASLITSKCNTLEMTISNGS